ncbi:MAG: dihydrodipicolinate synthase family protein [Oscillibacter sp.]|nr:dihydrodipicolinate synthase family protein [Oscillibacter sp.]
MKAAFLAPAITLFNEDGTLDLASQERLYDNLIEKGIDGILVEGSSSEFFAMNMEERHEMAKFAIEKVNHRVKLIIGTSNMVASEISAFSNFCLDAGADAVMILPPYYFHFGPEALLQYYDRLAKEIHGPIYIYNFPANTGYSVPVETVLQLALMHPNIVGLKDTIPGMDHTRELIKAVKSRIPTFEVYSGFDDNFARNVLSGGDGCIAALSNLAPEVTSAWVKAFHENDMEGIALGQQKIDRMMDIYNIREPFLPVLKEAIKLRGIVRSSASTFPMPNATIEDDARILELLTKEDLR